MPQELPQPALKPISRGPGSLLVGATYPFRALWLFARNPKFRGFVLLPIVINIFLGITIYGSSLYFGLQLIDAIATDLAAWMFHHPQLITHLPEVGSRVSQWAAPLSQGLSQIGETVSHGVGSLTSALPHWHLSLPHWSLNRPDWIPPFPNWNVNLPDWVQELPAWGAVILIWMVRVVLTLLLLLVTGFVFLQFGVLLGAPWYGKLSEEIERMRTGTAVVIEVGVAKDIGRAIAYELKKLVLGFGIGIPLLLLGFFPGVGTLAGTLGGIAITATLVCMDFMDGPLERRRLKFRQKLGIIGRSLPASATFGLVCLGLVSIPLINLLAVPLCVAAGTMFACDRVLPWLKLPDSQS